MARACIIILGLFATAALAGPYIEPGDHALRHDIQRLADYGVIKGPTSTWPLAWGPVLDDVQSYDEESHLPSDVGDALARVRAKGEWETYTDVVRYRARVSAQNQAGRLRSFQNMPREDGEISGGVSWQGERFNLDVVATIVSDPVDGEEVRPDGSQVAVALGNWTLAASTLDRWWGPAWDSSLVLSSNARPFPALTLDRRFTKSFSSKWLSWVGPWDLSVIWGQLEAERAIPNTRFLGIRFNFRPVRTLEIGITRTAQWCGDGRPCDASTLWNILVGQDNPGDGGVTFENDPSNQTAALDFRWSFGARGLPLALYGQFMGEDEAGSLPSRYLGQIGIEGSGYMLDRWSYRWYLEAAATNCEFWKSEDNWNCGYNHSVYETGYRYFGRVIGHTADNDSRVGTLGMVLVNREESSWQGKVRYGHLNRGGAADPANSLTPLRQEIVQIELIHNRVTQIGQFGFGIGYERTDDFSASQSSNDARAFIQWRSDY